MPSPRVTRIAILTATGVLLIFAAWEFSFLWPYIDAQRAIGTDHTFYVSVARRWLDTGQFYLPHQLAGPYVVRPDVDVLYPPISLLATSIAATPPGADRTKSTSRSSSRHQVTSVARSSVLTRCAPTADSTSRPRTSASTRAASGV